jgi:hypothetical protein
VANAPAGEGSGDTASKHDDAPKGEVQARLYGAPLGEVFNELTSTYAVSRGALAGVLGLSAPMLSQLASAQRVKIGNPAAVHRLQRLLSLAPEVRAGQIAADAALETVRSEASGQVLTRTAQVARRRGAADVQDLFRAVASAKDMERAAALLERAHPAIAEMLRVYGAGRTDAAVAHFERTVPR